MLMRGEIGRQLSVDQGIDQELGDPWSDIEKDY